MAQAELVEYTSLTAGSTFVMPDGKVIRFSGPKGGHGTYITDIPTEIAELDKLDASRTAQISRSTAGAKPADPALDEPVKEIVQDAERAASPAVASAVANLGKMLAADKAAGS